MGTYRIKFTVSYDDSYDFSAPGEAEALEAFWLMVNRGNLSGVRRGEVTSVTVEERES